jgi:hypothetical protein
MKSTSRYASGCEQSALGEGKFGQESRTACGEAVLAGTRTLDSKVGNFVPKVGMDFAVC